MRALTRRRRRHRATPAKKATKATNQGQALQLGHGIDACQLVDDAGVARIAVAVGTRRGAGYPASTFIFGAAIGGGVYYLLALLRPRAMPAAGASA